MAHQGSQETRPLPEPALAVSAATAAQEGGGPDELHIHCLFLCLPQLLRWDRLVFTIRKGRSRTQCPACPEPCRGGGHPCMFPASRAGYGPGLLAGRGLRARPTVGRTPSPGRAASHLLPALGAAALRLAPAPSMNSLEGRGKLGSLARVWPSPRTAVMSGKHTRGALASPGQPTLLLGPRLPTQQTAASCLHVDPGVVSSLLRGSSSLHGGGPCCSREPQDGLTSRPESEVVSLPPLPSPQCGHLGSTSPVFPPPGRGGHS